MSSPWIEAVRSVALNVPDLALAESFYTQTWRLHVAHRSEQAVYLRGSGSDHHLLALYAGPPVPQIRQVTLRARSVEALYAIADAVPRAGGRIVAPIGALTRDPAGGVGLTLCDPHGRVLQVVHGDVRMPPRDAARDAPRNTNCGPQRHRQHDPLRDQPERLTHVVLNSHAVDDTQRFLSEALGFTLADRTVAIAFMNCDRDHHTLAVGVADNDALNHIAFVMPDADAVMRGGGRMHDAGHPIAWGPGRHGPGDNLFNYFIDPFGIVIEYTAEVEQVDDSYVPRGPAQWQWPPGRIDQWGISPPPSPLLKEAQRRVRFAPVTDLSNP